MELKRYFSFSVDPRYILAQTKKKRLENQIFSHLSHDRELDSFPLYIRPPHIQKQNFRFLFNVAVNGERLSGHVQIRFTCS